MSDEDDDHEHYFLQPVKGYNIVEKIKLANEQLYEFEIPYKRHKSKVSFRENLVDFEPDCSSDDGYGESGTSTSDHESKKYNEKRCQMIEETCDLEKELENLRCISKERKKEEESDESEIEEADVEEEQEGCNQCGSSDDEIPDETECACENENYESDYENDDDENDRCNGDCTNENANAKQRKSNDCEECDIVEKVVAELVLKQIEAEDEANKPKPEPPKKKKPLYKSKFGRFGRHTNENTTFEVIETEHGRFRGCCRHKVEHIEGMPQYKGAVSLYGLSEEQYEKREERLQKLEELEQQKLAKIKEEYIKKANESEDAFSQWLKQKAKSKPSRIKNMYDHKPKKPQKVLTGQKGPNNRKVLPKLDTKLNNNNLSEGQVT
uniref:CSON015261 protein n=1 Tax=Culicoides sonorensis TaxID=179676 RepID=A0A336LTB7_CULSO